MFELQPVAYGNLADEIIISIASRITDGWIRADKSSEHPYGRRWIGWAYQHRVAPSWPLTLEELIRLGYKKWLMQIRSLKPLIDELFYPDGRAHPYDRVLLHNKEDLAPLREVRAAQLFVPTGENRVGLKTDKSPTAFMRSRRIVWLPHSQHPEQLEASDYQDECRRLQATKAGRKAKRLLMDNLTETQRRDYLTKGVFIVAGNSQSGRHYYIIDNSFPNGNIFMIKRGKVVGDYCFHPADPYPLDDIILTQKLLIETDEDGFQKEANYSPRNSKDYFMPDMNGYPIATADRGWSDSARFVPQR